METIRSNGARGPAGTPAATAQDLANGLVETASLARHIAEARNGFAPEQCAWQARQQQWRTSPLVRLGSLTPFLWGWPPGVLTNDRAAAPQVVGSLAEAARRGSHSVATEGPDSPPELAMPTLPAAGTAAVPARQAYSPTRGGQTAEYSSLDVGLLRCLWALGRRRVKRFHLERRLDEWLHLPRVDLPRHTQQQADGPQGPPQAHGAALALEALAWCHALSQVAACCDATLLANLTQRLRDWAAAANPSAAGTGTSAHAMPKSHAPVATVGANALPSCARQDIVAVGNAGDYSDVLAWQLWSAELPLAVHYVMSGADGAVDASASLAALQRGLQHIDPQDGHAAAWLARLGALVACWTRCLMVAQAAGLELLPQIRQRYVLAVVRLLQCSRASGQAMLSTQESAGASALLREAAMLAGGDALAAWRAWKLPRRGTASHARTHDGDPAMQPLTVCQAPNGKGGGEASLARVADGASSSSEAGPPSREVPDGARQGGCDGIPPAGGRNGLASDQPGTLQGTLDESASESGTCPAPWYCHESAGLAVLRGEATSDAPCLAIVRERAQVYVELEAGGILWLHGPWETRVWLGGERLPPPATWEQTVWETSDEALYVEWEGHFGDTLLVQRGILLSRKDRFVLMGDALLGTERAELRCEMHLSIPAGVRWQPADETQEGWLLARRSRLRLLPLGLPEWRCDPRPGSLDLEPCGLTLRQQSPHALRMFVPLWIDLDARRGHRPCTWRHLTVGEDLAVVPPEVASAYRVQVGREQWLVYRTLAPAASRTVLGHHLVTELLVGRFNRRGLVDPILELE